MPNDSARAQEPYECFGIPLRAEAEADVSIPRSPPGWNRRAWILPEATLLGAEALPSSPVDAAFEIEQVR